MPDMIIQQHASASKLHQEDAKVIVGFGHDWV
jgi:hypothetical protein